MSPATSATAWTWNAGRSGIEVVMSQDDPFGLNDPERTRIARPQPGGRGPTGSSPAPAARAGTGAPLPEGTAGRGPLVQAAFGFLMLAPRLRARTPPTDPIALR